MVVHVEHTEDAPPIRSVYFKDLIFEPYEGQSLLYFFIIYYKMKFAELLLSIIFLELVVAVLPAVGSAVAAALVALDVDLDV